MLCDNNKIITDISINFLIINNVIIEFVNSFTIFYFYLFIFSFDYIKLREEHLYNFPFLKRTKYFLRCDRLCVYGYAVVNWLGSNQTSGLITGVINVTWRQECARYLWHIHT